MRINDIISESIKATYKASAGSLLYEKGYLDSRNGGAVMFTDTFYALLVSGYDVRDQDRAKLAERLGVDRLDLIKPIIKVKKLKSSAEPLVEYGDPVNTYDEGIQKTDGPLAGLFKKAAAEPMDEVAELTMQSMLYDATKELLRVYKGEGRSGTIYALVPERYTKAIRAAGSAILVKDQARAYDGSSLHARINGSNFNVLLTTTGYDIKELLTGGVFII